LIEGVAAREYLKATMSTVGGGANEIQKGIIAQRGLGMPR
jgi:hypothetical protein